MYSFGDNLERIIDKIIATLLLQTPMVSYLNVHAVLEGRRSRAKASSSDDPESSQVIFFVSHN